MFVKNYRFRWSIDPEKSQLERVSALTAEGQFIQNSVE